MAYGALRTAALCISAVLKHEMMMVVVVRDTRSTTTSLQGESSHRMGEHNKHTSLVRCGLGGPPEIGISAELATIMQLFTNNSIAEGPRHE